jgi:hypothetical protein
MVGSSKAEGRRHLLVGVEPDGQRDAELLRHARRLVAVVVEVDGHDAHAARTEAPLQLLQLGQLGATRRAPRGPEVDHRDAPAQRRRGHVAVADQRRQRELGRHAPSRDRAARGCTARRRRQRQHQQQGTSD